ncbi:MAG: hypothetical protein ABSG63_07530 [Spirochaetia bacterium]
MPLSRRRIATLLLACLLCPCAGADSAPAPGLTLGGYTQLWYLYEQAPNGKKQDVTEDMGAQEASGFNLYRARLTASGRWENAGMNFMLRLEGGSVGLLDAYGYWQVIGRALEIDAGQMKIPSAWEVLVPDEDLDFVTRSRFASEIANWSLSKSPFSTSPFYYVQTQNRDLGAAAKGEFRGLSYMVMIGNGLGAGNYIGADENRGFVYANPFGAYFYGGRLTYDLLTELRETLGVPAAFVVGGHYCINNHPNFIYNDAKTVLDINRSSWSVDAHMGLFDVLRLTGMYGEGVVNDDYDNDGQTDYTYRGWEVSAMVVIVKDFLEAGARFDSYAWNRAVTSGWANANALTAGVNFSWTSHVRLQLNYKYKFQTGDLTQATDAHVLLLSTQVRF